MVYAGEEAQHDGHPLYVQLARRLLQAGAAGATALRSIWATTVTMSRTVTGRCRWAGVCRC
jgi:PII-like signaling protein